MAKVIQVIDVNSDGWKVRLDDGKTVDVKHGDGTPHVGEECPLPPVSLPEVSDEERWKQVLRPSPPRSDDEPLEVNFAGD